VGAVFTPEECQFLEGQEMGRLATVGSGGLPHVMPVSFELNRELQTIDIGGWKLTSTLKYRHVANSGVAAFVVDDVLPPFLPRLLEVRGRAEVTESDDRPLIRIWPRLVLSRGLDGATHLVRRRVDEVPSLSEDGPAGGAGGAGGPARSPAGD